MRAFNLAILFIACLHFPKDIRAQQIDLLDPTFGEYGILKPDSTLVVGGTAMTLQQDGRILTAYTSIILSNPIQYLLNISRYLSDGSRDYSFSDSGRISIPISALATVVGISTQRTGKIVTLVSTGYYQGNAAQLFRLEANGRPDSSLFGLHVNHPPPASTTYYTAFFDLEIDIFDRIWLTGIVNMIYPDVHCYTADGKLDSTLGALDAQLEGVPFILPHSTNIELSGDILIVGSARNNPSCTSCWGIARYRASGAIDSSFNQNGYAHISLPAQHLWFATNSAIRPDGSYIIAGTSRAHSAPRVYCLLMAINRDGTIDSSWGNNGSYYIDSISAGVELSRPLVKVQPDGKLLVIFGSTSDSGACQFAVYRLMANGVPDESFGVSGKQRIEMGVRQSIPESIAVQPDGKIIISGRWAWGYGNAGDKIGLVRFNASIRDPEQIKSCQSLGLIVSPNPVASSTRVSYILEKNGTVQLDLLSVDGKLVTKVLNSAYRWQGANADYFEIPSNWPAGIYVLRLIADNKRCSMVVGKP